MSIEMEELGVLAKQVVRAVVVAFLAYKAWEKFRYRLPPGPRPWPLVGNLLQIKPVAFRCFWEWSNTYGPIMSVWTGSALNIVVSNSELAKEVLRDNDQYLSHRPRSRSIARLTNNGTDLIWADYGPHYVKVRKVCNLELFTPNRLDALRPIREEEITSMVASLFQNLSSQVQSNNNVITLRKYLSTVAFNNVTRVTLGKRFVDNEGNMDPQGVELKAIVSNGTKLDASTAMVEHIRFLRWMFPFQEKQLAEQWVRSDNLTKAIMEEHTLSRSKNGAQQHFVDALLTLQDQYNLSNDTIGGLLWNMIVAGMDTTAIASEWAMAQLVRNPTVQKKAHEELDRVIGKVRILTELDLPNLPYLQCIVKETLRLHPPTPLMLPHKASRRVKVGGYDIPKGSNVLVNVWAIGRDPAVWKDPMKFRPERFMEESVDVKGHDYRLLPFGAGRRMCPGIQLSLYLVETMIGRLVHHFEWFPPQHVKAEDIDLAESAGLVTYMAKPVEAIAIPRLPSHLYQ